MHAWLTTVFLLMVTFASPSVAAELTQAKANASISLQEFVQAHPDCMDFTDQCSICSQQSGELVCSTPKIACIQKELSCTRSRAPDADEK